MDTVLVQEKRLNLAGFALPASVCRDRVKAGADDHSVVWIFQMGWVERRVAGGVEGWACYQ